MLSLQQKAIQQHLWPGTLQVLCSNLGKRLLNTPLVNVKSGDLLSEIARESSLYSLAACPRERLLAIGFMDSKVNFEVLQVKLPGDKHSRGGKESSLKSEKSTLQLLGISRRIRRLHDVAAVN
ncbi:uncharacterized protein LOC141886642 [Acropora palmata]|uniref:uncharacterized protein LOC141886642 n=1 Tax=Acropora palmata TaxID=6131 RepID=UPI003DA16CBE